MIRGRLKPETTYREITDYKPQSPQRTQRETKKKLVKFDRVEFDRAFGFKSEPDPKLNDGLAGLIDYLSIV